MHKGNTVKGPLRLITALIGTCIALVCIGIVAGLAWIWYPRDTRITR